MSQELVLQVAVYMYFAVKIRLTLVADGGSIDISTTVLHDDH